MQPIETEGSNLPITVESETNLIRSIHKLLEDQDLSLRTVEVKDAMLILVRPESNLLPVKKIPVLVNAQLDISSPKPNQIDIVGKLFHVEIQLLLHCLVLQHKLMPGVLMKNNN